MKKITARKRFGQNFLQDQHVIMRIIEAINPQDHEHLLEIGPGLGALTKAILPQLNQLDAVELDRDLIPLLEKDCEPLGKLVVHQGNALKFDFSTLMHQQKLRVFGNLPYNISTPLLFHLFEQAGIIQDMHFMLQEEVVDRLAAEPNTKTYGRLSIMTQYFCRVEKLFTIPPEAFSPQPKVYSAVVRLTPHDKPPHPANDVKLLSELVNIAFQQRRKTLRNALKSLIDGQNLDDIGIQPSQRPENLSLENYVKICNYLSK